MTKYENEFKAAAKKYNLEKRLLEAIAQVESNFNPAAIGDGGKSIGIMQIYMPAHPQHSKENLLKAAYNIDAGAAILRAAINKHGGNIGRGIIQYNGNHGRATASGAAYLKKVLSAYESRPKESSIGGAAFILIISAILFSLQTYQKHIKNITK